MKGERNTKINQARRWWENAIRHQTNRHFLLPCENFKPRDQV